MTKEEKLEREELQILLNVLGRELEVTYPPLNLPFVSIHTTENHYEVEVTVDKEDFVESLDYGILEREIPSFDDLFECLLHSGVLQYSNLDEFREKVRSFQSLNRTVFFAPDTNLFYHGFIVNCNLIRPERILLINTVRDEIEASLNYRYNNRQINQLKKQTRFHSTLFDELRHKRMKTSRRAAYLALQDLRAIRDQAITVEAIRDSVADDRENDLTIAKTLNQYLQESNRETLLLTADNLMTDICFAEGIPHFYLKVPHEIGNHLTAQPRQIRRLLYNLASLWGFIKVNNTIIFGEFHGKETPDQLQTRILNRHTRVEFQRELKICRKLINLKIT